MMWNPSLKDTRADEPIRGVNKNIIKEAGITSGLKMSWFGDGRDEIITKYTGFKLITLSFKKIIVEVSRDEDIAIW